MKIGPFSSHQSIMWASPPLKELHCGRHLVLKGCNERRGGCLSLYRPSQRSPVRCQRDGPPPLRGRAWRPRTPRSGGCRRVPAPSPPCVAGWPSGRRADIEASAAVRTVSSDASSIVTKSPRSRLPDRIAAAISAAPRAPKTSAAIETASISVPASLTCRASSSSASTGSVMPLPARLPRPIFMPARAASMFTPPFSKLTEDRY